MKTDEDKLLVRIAEMYYQEDKNQSQIAKELNIHRTTISRLLKRSREEGIVQITINYDLAGTYSIEQTLEKTYGLTRAIVVPVAPEMQTKQKEQLIGKAAADYLASVAAAEMKIGFSWGQSLAAMVEAMEAGEKKDITCIPMIGGPSGKLASEYHVNTIAYEAAKKLGGRALMIDSPAITDTPELRDALLQNDFNKVLFKLWQELDIAIFGIGSPHLSKKDVWRAFYGEQVISELAQYQTVGDIVSRFYDREGQPISLELSERIIGIELADLKQCPIRIGVAESKEKAPSILGALRGEYLTTLVTTEETAKELLRLSE